MFLVICLIVISIGICLHHNVMKQKFEHVSNIDIGLLSNAIELSIEAANTINPILALTHSIKAVNIIEMLHHRYGVSILQDLTKHNTLEILDVLRLQRDRILEDLLEKHRSLDFKSNHPLKL